MVMAEQTNHLDFCGEYPFFINNNNNNNIFIRTLGTLAQLYGYYDSSYKYQLSICDNLRHVMTLARAGFGAAQRGHICSLPGALTIRPPDRDGWPC